MLEEFITSALIIDDKEEEINQLQKFLESKDIWVKHYTPDNLDERIQQEYKLKNRKIIFLDLHLDEAQDLTHNAAKIRRYFSKLLGCDFGSYGKNIPMNSMNLEISCIKITINIHYRSLW